MARRRVWSASFAASAEPRMLPVAGPSQHLRCSVALALQPGAAAFEPRLFDAGPSSWRSAKNLSAMLRCWGGCALRHVTPPFRKSHSKAQQRPAISSQNWTDKTGAGHSDTVATVAAEKRPGLYRSWSCISVEDNLELLNHRAELLPAAEIRGRLNL